ncbi:MAG: hypothetical protein WDO14_21550 [Bacteroidota bacterium]
MKTFANLVLCCIVFAACSSKETQVSNETGDTTQVPAADTTAQPTAPETIEEEITPGEQHALDVIDSITQSISSHDSIPSYIRILTNKLLDRDAINDNDIVATLISAGYTEDKEGEDVSFTTYCICTFKKDGVHLVPYAKDYFYDGSSGAFSMTTENSFDAREVIKDHFAIEVSMHVHGFNGAGTTDYTTATLYITRAKQLQSIFDLTTSELYEAASDGSTEESTATRYYDLQQDADAFDDMFYLVVTEGSEDQQETGKTTLYRWSGDKYEVARDSR